MSTIDPDQWQRLSPLLDEVLDLDPADRTEHIEALRLKDATLADSLLGLLQERDAADRQHFLDEAAAPVVGELPANAPSLEGTAIGSYVIESFLGQGGSGSVWRARRADERIGGVVAIKLLHWSMLGHAGRQRFEREGAILARLAHPHIARLIDAGVTPAGQPYLVLDLVTGQTITRYCDARRLDVDQRLALFVDVLSAVAHAHSHLIVHRDLKPSNILVGADGVVKLLDFGIAKLLEDESEGGAVTADGQRALTPNYAAPEQLRGTAISTATDIYALGVLCYELLAGRHPTSDDATSSHEVMRATLETDPVPLPRALTVSTTRTTGELTEIAAGRGTTPERLRRRLRGDLENIVARMLRKNPAERYQTAAELAEDLRRYRANEPVSARPDSWSYRVAKFTRRHRAAVAAVALVALSLAAGLAGTISQARRAEAEAAKARIERDTARRQLSYAESSNEFITFLLDQGGSDKPVIMRDLLARGEALVTKQFADDAATRARLQMHLSSLYAQGGQSDKAQAMLEAAKAAAGGVDDPTLHATIDCGLAWQASERGSFDAALGMMDKALARLDTAVDRETATSARAECLFARGQLRFVRGEGEPSVADLQLALATLEQPRTDQRTLAIRIRSTLALALHRIGRAAEAVGEYARVVAELEAMGRGNTQLVASLYNNQAVLLNSSGQPRRALEASARAFEVARGSGTTDPVLEAVYAKFLADAGRPREALPFAEHALASARTGGNERIRTIALQNAVATFRGLGDFARCEALLNEIGDTLARTKPGGTSQASLQVQRAEVALARGDVREASRLLALAVPAYGEPPGANINGITPLILLARAEQQLGDLPSARRHVEQAVAGARKAMTGFEHSRLLGSALVAQGLVQRASGELEAARASWTAALVELQATAGEGAPATVEARRLLAGA
jgi:serine/threonine-protein kinase